jgi:hypothetical protein
MCRQCFSLPQWLPVVLLGLLVLCVPLAWTQRILLTKQTSVQLSDHAVPLAAFPETKSRLFTSYGKMPLIFTPDPGQTQAGPGFSSRGSGYHLLPPTKSLLGLDSKSNYLIARPPPKWQTNVPTPAYHHRVYARDLQYYGRRMPLIGPTILHVLKQADSHPRVTRVLQLLKPQF